MEVPPRKLLEQTAVSFRISAEGESLLVPILQRNEVAVLQTARILPAIGIKLEILQRRRRRLVETEQIDDESDVPPIIGDQRRRRRVLVEPVAMRRSRGVTVAGKVQPKMRENREKKRKSQNVMTRVRPGSARRKWTVEDGGMAE